ncbi:plant UBX domain-containing protein 10-like [Populus alba x Populus x berolinensis]|nr:plant UBX domain-containing protein 10-like [Populus alba x Populus x berolinensis]
MSWSTRESSRATREVSFNGIVRRMVNLPRSIAGGFCRVMGHGIGRIGIGGRRDQNPIPNFPLQPPQEPLIAPEEWTFLSVFEQQYGSTHPFFYACQFMEALKTAEDEHKWKGRFPGRVVEILQRTVEEQGLAFGNSRAKEEETTRAKAIEEERKRARAKEEEKMRADRQLREEQDAAYLAALKIDKEKEKLNSLLPERKFQKPADSSNKANYEKLRQDASQKQFGKSKEAILLEKQLTGPKMLKQHGYIDSLGLPGDGNYRLISSFPRRVYSVDQMGINSERCWPPP